MCTVEAGNCIDGTAPTPSSRDRERDESSDTRHASAQSSGR
jgi:hypothetical protein